MKKVEKKEKKKVQVGSIIDVIKYPLLAIVILLIIGIFVKALSLMLDTLALLIYGYTGWSAVKKYKFSIWKAAAAGVLVVFIAAVIYLVILAALGKTMLEVEGVNLEERGVPPEAIGTVTLVATIISIIVSSIIRGILALVGAIIAQKIR